MPHWLIDIEHERQRARQSSHEGRTRTSARRIAGIALAELRRSTAGAAKEDNFIVLLGACAHDASMPEPVRAAASRLAERVGADFTSPSTEPMRDAEVIVEFVASALQKS